MENFHAFPCFDHWNLLGFLKSWTFSLDQSEVQTGKHTVTLLNFVFIKWVIFNCLKLAIFSSPPRLEYLEDRKHQRGLIGKAVDGLRHFIITGRIKTRKQPVSQFGASISCQKFDKEAVVQQFHAKLCLRKYSLSIQKAGDVTSSRS